MWLRCERFKLVEPEPGNSVPSSELASSREVALMRIEVIGGGKMGAALIYSLMLMRSGLNILLVEPHRPNRSRALAEYCDLLPVAVATGNKLAFGLSVSDASSCYIMTAGLARKSPHEPKELLLPRNLPIVLASAGRIPKEKRIFIITNPPKLLAKALKRGGWARAVPLRDETDKLRARAGNAQELNSYVLLHKGHTAFTPGFACAKAVLDRVRP